MEGANKNLSAGRQDLPRDVFLYLLAVITLIVSAISFGVLVFQIINIYFPDIVADMYARSGYLNMIRQSIAVLVVVFSVFLFISRFLKKDIGKNPEKRELKVRKWLLYLTLFAAALVIIGDLVVLIQNFLQGELTVRFILKVASVLFIAGSIFYHYYFELKSEVKRVGLFYWIDIAVIILAIIFGFYVAGLPSDQRLIRLDERRVNDLQSIQGQILNYWQMKRQLPANLDVSKNDIGGFNVPIDPETNNPYEYKVLGNLKFHLCAKFSSSNIDENKNKPMPMSYPAQPSIYPYYDWSHEKGYQCFERTIDPSLYPPVKPL